MISSKVIFSVYVCLILFFLTGCDPNRLLDENLKIESYGWPKNDARSFSFDITDTSQSYNIYVNVRNSSKYKYRNLYLFIEMTSPSEKYIVDTVDIQLADNTGKWKGSGIGNIWQIRQPLMMNVRLLEKGKYDVIIKHGMRHDTLMSITDIGLRVENIK